MSAVFIEQLFPTKTQRKFLCLCGNTVFATETQSLKCKNNLCKLYFIEQLFPTKTQSTQRKFLCLCGNTVLRQKRRVTEFKERLCGKTHSFSRMIASFGMFQYIFFIKQYIFKNSFGIHFKLIGKMF